MNDHSHLKRAHKDDEAKEALLEPSAIGSLECLNEMKHISALIEKVTLIRYPDLLNYYYIGRHYILKIRVYLFDNLHYIVRSPVGWYC